MIRDYYSDSIAAFKLTDFEQILGKLSQNNQFDLLQAQRNAWIAQIDMLKEQLADYDGRIYFEYAIPRMGRRIDVLLIIGNSIFVLEFKVGQKEFSSGAIDQVMDYALDLKNFHETSQSNLIAPILISTGAAVVSTQLIFTPHDDQILEPIRENGVTLSDTIARILLLSNLSHINPFDWEQGKYSPTPTIIEAAKALYNSHSVADITRNDAAAENLNLTTACISEIIDNSRALSRKSICFVTGVPGAGKTLIGLNVATQFLSKESGLTSVFLSGNGPLVAILREALTRDKVQRVKEGGGRIRKGDALREIKLFIQNVHHFRDEYLNDKEAPADHIAIFDEAQRAWNHEQTAKFMQRKKNVPDFAYSEPEFLISCMDRHKDWTVIICLVGGGQEINTGEAGISEWIDSLNRSFPQWNVYISSQLMDSEYAAGKALSMLGSRINVALKKELHLSVSMRSFRAEHVSSLVKSVLDIEVDESRKYYKRVMEKYPIALTRDLSKAKAWLQKKARGSERYGLVVSSRAQRLKPLAIDVKSPMDPVHWFLDGKDDVRSSYFLEDVATEFHVQGLELDWACITWDADFRFNGSSWGSFSFEGDRWNNVKKEERRVYLKNAYRVLLTRARQGMIIVVPYGNTEDATRSPKFYDQTFEYLSGIGFEIV